MSNHCIAHVLVAIVRLRHELSRIDVEAQVSMYGNVFSDAHRQPHRVHRRRHSSPAPYLLLPRALRRLFLWPLALFARRVPDLGPSLISVLRRRPGPRRCGGGSPVSQTTVVARSVLRYRSHLDHSKSPSAMRHRDIALLRHSQRIWHTAPRAPNASVGDLISSSPTAVLPQERRRGDINVAWYLATVARPGQPASARAATRPAQRDGRADEAMPLQAQQLRDSGLILNSKSPEIEAHRPMIPSADKVAAGPIMGRV